MQKVVIDTNIVVSALLTRSYSSRIIYELVLEKKVLLCLSAEVWEEYVDVKIVSPKEYWQRCKPE